MKLKAVLCVVSLFAVAAVADAGPITPFNDRIAFAAAVGAATTDDFGDNYAFPISTGVLDSTTNLVTGSGGPILPGRVQPGVQYSTPLGQGNFFNIDLGAGFDGGFLDGGLGNFSPLTVSFTGPVGAFGFDTNTLMGASFAVTINFVSGPAFQQTYAGPAGYDLAFFGFASNASDIVSARIVSSGDSDLTFALDNFTVAGAANVDPVPEPGSMLLLGTGVIGLARAWRRKK